MANKRTRFALRTVAQLRLSALPRSEKLDPRKTAAWALLLDIIDDGQPEPQITRNPTGAIEVNWLVNGRFMGLLVEEDGYELWAEDPSGQEIFSHGTLSPRDDPRHDEYMQRASRYLVELGKEVVDE